MEKLSNLEHKFLFYFGFLVVILFISLSVWQFNSYLQDKETIQKLIDTESPIPVTISDLYTNNQEIIFEYNNVQIIDGAELDIVKTWYLRSRVHNGENGYHLVTLYKHNISNRNILVKNGWIPLDLSLIHISEPTRPLYISYAVFCLKKKKTKGLTTHFEIRLGCMNSFS